MARQSQHLAARRRGGGGALALALAALLAALCLSRGVAADDGFVPSPRLQEAWNILKSAERAFGTPDAQVRAGVSKEQLDAVLGGAGAQATGGVISKTGGTLTATNCLELWSLFVLASQQSLMNSKGTARWTIFLDCPSPGVAPVYDCYAPGTSPDTLGNLMMVIQGKTRMTVKPAARCGSTRPLLTSSGAANITVVNGTYSNNIAAFSLFAAGTDSDQYIKFTTLELQNVDIDGAGKRTCILASNARTLTLRNVNLRNCQGVGTGAALFGYDTNIQYTTGTIENAKAYSWSVKKDDVDFRGAGGAYALEVHRRGGTLSTFQNVVFNNNWHQNLGGAFYFTNYNQEAGSNAVFRGSNGFFSGNTAGAVNGPCGLGAVFRADRFLRPNGRVQMGNWRLTLNVGLSGNGGPLVVNGVAYVALLCTTLQNEVSGGDYPMNVSVPTNRASRVSVSSSAGGNQFITPIGAAPLPKLQIPNSITENIWGYPA